MAGNQKTIILKYKKSDSQFKYEDGNIIKPLIAKVPKARSGRTHALKLPKYISFTIDESTKTLHLYIQEQEGVRDGKRVVLNATCNNMQSDNAAFEGWAICLKAWLPEHIETVVLKWDAPGKEGEKDMTRNNKQHYRRFLYRVLRFSQQYSWFSIDNNNKQSVIDFNDELYDLQNNNYSENPKLKGSVDDLSETSVEYLLTTKFADSMKERFELDNIDRQFPVGVKRRGEQFFTGGMSAIDLWGMKDNILTIIELKYNGGKTKNKKVGIISELFMYSNIMRDIISGKIKRPALTRQKSEGYFYERHQTFSELKAFMLSDEYHPLVDNETVIELLNNCSCLDGGKVVYDKLSYRLTTNSKLELL